MKKKNVRFWMTGGLVLAGVLLFCSGVTVGAATSEPGSAGDPLITKSYLDRQLEGLGNSYECLTLKKGEKLLLSQGSCVIVYTGNATVEGSLIDVTAGSLMTAGSAAVKYHSYLATADESGFTAQGTCVIFLSGKEY